MKLRSFVSLLLVLLLALALPVQALAAEYDLANGTVDITAHEGGNHTVVQGSTTQEDTAPVVTGTYSGKETAITIRSDEGATANVTLKGVDITTTVEKVSETLENAIEIEGKSEAVITVSGENRVITDTPSGTNGQLAAIHVSEGDLTITGGQGDSLYAGCTGTRYSSAATIGTDWDEDMSGNITITGDGLKVEVKSQGDGAGVGAGQYGTMKGNITIDGKDVSVTIRNTAQVNSNGAGIGAGSWSLMTGNVTIGGDGTEVTIDRKGSVPSQEYGPGIGAGISGAFGDGTITVEGTANVNLDGIGNPSDSEGVWGDFVIDTTASINGTHYTAVEDLPDFIRTENKTVRTPGADPEAPAEGQSSGAAVDTDQSAVPAPTYRVVDKDGKWLAHEAQWENGTLTAAVEEETASFLASRAALLELRKQGVQTVVFVTSGKTSSFDLAEALAALSAGELALAHRGAEATLTLGDEVHNELLKSE